MIVNLKPFVRGLLSYLIPSRFIPRKGTGGSNSAKYCYSVWLRHLVQLRKCGLLNRLSDITRVAELGPGDSLGIGIAAIFSGATEYYALDVIEHTNVSFNKLVAKSILELFANNTPIPNGDEFSCVNPMLEDYKYPSEILYPFGHRINDIGKEIELALDKQSTKVKIEYVVPWNKAETKISSSLDLIYSQAVMEHVEDIKDSYKTMYKWLRPGGIISHQIDFKAHEISDYWSGHWYISKPVWSILMHGRKYIINRNMLSDHVKAIEECGFEIKNVVSVINENPIKAKKISLFRKSTTDSDLITSSCLIQAVKSL